MKNAKTLLRGVRFIPTLLAVTVGILAIIELVAWMAVPDRYADPPAVTTEAWIRSDALASADTVWMKEFVDEFCRSYNAHWTSYLYFRRDPFTGKHIVVDSNGIRRTPQPGSPPTHRPLRVFLFGGSTMWGTGARDAGTIPAALAMVISSDPTLPPAHVVNMGESGYVSTQCLLRLLLALQQGNIPDIVVLYDGVNDVFSAYQNHGAGLPQNEFHRSLEFNLLKHDGRMIGLGVQDLFSRSLTGTIVTGIGAMLAPAVPRAPLWEDSIQGIVDVYRGNLAIAEGLSRQFGFRLAAYWQPVVFSRKNPSPYERQQSDLMRDMRPVFLAAYAALGADSSLRDNPSFHNISDLFDSTGLPVYLDFCHTSELGNARIARRILEDVGPMMRASSPVNARLAPLSRDVRR